MLLVLTFAVDAVYSWSRGFLVSMALLRRRRDIIGFFVGLFPPVIVIVLDLVVLLWAGVLCLCFSEDVGSDPEGFDVDEEKGEEEEEVADGGGVELASDCEVLSRPG